MTIAIVTDSSACLPTEVIEEYGITVMPLNLIFGDKTYRDGIDITPTQFYTLLQKSETIPTTSAPSTGHFINVYRRLAQNADGIICILISSKLSASYEAAIQAKDLAKEGLPNTAIEVIDSHTTSNALGFIVRETARAAAGGSMDEAMAVAHDMMERVRFFAALDTLKYLAKGGRIGRAAAWSGNLLRIKPVLTISNDTGEVSGVERPRTKSKAIERVLEIMREEVGKNPVHVAVAHANASSEAQHLKDKVSEVFDCLELSVAEFTPVLGTHVGPGLVGVIFYTEKNT
ncbi:MAG: DegV family protein [Dehalococcoidia bacterium]